MECQQGFERCSIVKGVFREPLFESKKDLSSQDTLQKAHTKAEG